METTEKLRYNPIPITSMTLFPKMQTQFLYSRNDIVLSNINKYEIWYKIDYEEYIVHKEKNVKCHYVEYSQQNRNLFSYKFLTGPVSISDKCFDGNIEKSITIPNTVTSIGISCFYECYYLENIVLSNRLNKINNYCFELCDSLTSIVIPSSIQSIGRYCFDGCFHLQSINIPDTVNYIGNSCFRHCTSLQTIILPSTLVLLEDHTFYNCCSLINIKFPTQLLSIGNNCFEKCVNLTTITLPPSLLQIEKFCFKDSKIQSIEIPDSVKIIGVDLKSNNNFTFKVSYCDSLLYKQFGIICNNIILTRYDVDNMLDELKQQQNNVYDFIIPNGVVELDNVAFSFKKYIKSISIPTTVTSIGNYCFSGCSSLTTLLIPSSVKIIGNYSFKQCKSLTSFSLPLNVNNKFKVSHEDFSILKKCGIISNNLVFDNSDYNKFTRTIPVSIPLILNIHKETKETLIPNNIVSMKSNHLSKDITSIIIPTNVTYLCNDCFKGYSKLQSITIPSSIKFIGKHLIDGCIKLTQLNYDGNWNNIIVSYSDHLRYKSIGLLFNSIEYTNDDKIKYGNVIPSIVNSLQRSYYDRSNEIFHIPTHITSLDNNLFQSLYGTCSKLRSISIPPSVTIIPKYCFSKCYLLTSIELPTTLKIIQKYSFSNCISLQSIIIPSSVISIEKYAFENCCSLTTIILPTQIQILRNECLKGCEQLKNKLNVPDSCF
ncbi:hypothetical protein QTN25_000300 [Entamoeba marina]